jgi:hypothetical protein
LSRAFPSQKPHINAYSVVYSDKNKEVPENLFLTSFFLEIVILKIQGQPAHVEDGILVKLDEGEIHVLRYA